MKYPYKILPQSLQATADAAIGWFVANWGVRKTGIRVEEQFDPDVELSPTFHALLDDGHVLCVEVGTTVYDNTLDSAVLKCRNKGLPVKLFVAVPKGVEDPRYAQNFRNAKNAGVGLLEVDEQSGDIVQQALSASLAGLRTMTPADFPAKFRHSLQHAHQTFRDGEPSKACSLIYDELEGSCRVFAKKCEQKGLWQKPGKMNIDTVQWARLLHSINDGLDRTNTLARPVSKALLARIIGVTPHRNDSGHRPGSLRERIKRDLELRTRFESAADLLKDFLEATKPFRL